MRTSQHVQIILLPAQEFIKDKKVCYSEATVMFFTSKSNVSLTDRGYLNTEIKNLQAMKWCDVINLIYFLPAINDSRKLKNKYN